MSCGAGIRVPQQASRNNKQGPFELLFLCPSCWVRLKQFVAQIGLLAHTHSPTSLKDIEERLKKKKKKLGKINALGPGNPNSWNQWVNVEATDKSQLLQPFQLEAVELGLERAKGLSLLLF